MSGRNAYGTHKLLLSAILRRVNKSVLELGVGHNSTPLIHNAMKRKNIDILTIDSDSYWIRRYAKLKSDKHKFKYYNSEELKGFYATDTTAWELVFVDNSPWEARTQAINKYREIADYVILHDCNYFPDTNIFGKTISPINANARVMGKRNYDDIFKYWVEFFVDDWGIRSPPTLLGSNKINVEAIVIEGMVIANKSNYNE